MYSLMRRLEDSNIVISTSVIVNPYFSRMFDAVAYVRPESYFNIDQYDAAEKIFSLVAELRELKYREWFHLPPFANVYHIKVKAKDLRKLGKEMRTII